MSVPGSHNSCACNGVGVVVDELHARLVVNRTFSGRQVGLQLQDFKRTTRQGDMQVGKHGCHAQRPSNCSKVGLCIMQSPLRWRCPCPKVRWSCIMQRTGMKNKRGISTTGPMGISMTSWQRFQSSVASMPSVLELLQAMLRAEHQEPATAGHCTWTSSMDLLLESQPSAGGRTGACSRGPQTSQSERGSRALPILLLRTAAPLRRAGIR